MERLTHIADFGMEDWEETLFLVPSDPAGAYNILDIARHQGEPEFNEILKNISLRLAAIEEILGDEYDIDELAEMVQAKREGRCVVLPCKVGDTVYQVDYMTHSEAIKSGVPQSNDPWQKRKYGRKRAAYLPLIVREKKMVKTLYHEFGKTVFLTRAEAEEALRREQDG